MDDKDRCRAAFLEAVKRSGLKSDCSTKVDMSERGLSVLAEVFFETAWAHQSAALAAAQEREAKLREAAEKMVQICTFPGLGAKEREMGVQWLRAALSQSSHEQARQVQGGSKICPMCHGDGMCEQPVAAPAGVEIPKYPKIKCPACGGTGHYDH